MGQFVCLYECTRMYRTCVNNKYLTVLVTFCCLLYAAVLVDIFLFYVYNHCAFAVGFDLLLVLL